MSRGKPVQILSRVKPSLTLKTAVGSRRSTNTTADKTCDFEDYLNNRDFIGAMTLLTVGALRQYSTVIFAGGV